MTKTWKLGGISVQGLAGAGRYLAASALVLAVDAGVWVWGGGLGGPNLAMLFLAPVVVSAVAFGLGPALLSAGLAVVSFNFLFIEPRFTFRIERPADLLTFSMFFVVAMATGWLAGRARDEGRNAHRQATTVGLLLDASRSLTAATTPREVAQALADHAMAIGAGAAVVLLPGQEGLHMEGGPATLDRLSPEAETAARQVFETGAAPVGADTAGDWRFLPLEGSQGRLGVIGLRHQGGESGDGAIGALIRQGAVALERAVLAAAMIENQGLRRADQLRTALLNSISHDFRTPLSTVLGSATTLLDYQDDLKPAVRRDLLESIREEAIRLNRYVGGLLDMARLEAGALEPRQVWTDAPTVIDSALRRLGDRLGQRRVETDFARDLPKLRLDPTLLEQAVLNLLENAITHAPAGTRISISATEDASGVMLSFEDDGPGIPSAEMGGIFDRFRRLERGTDRGEGLGLGLSIARGFVEAMGGAITATPPLTPDGGARFLIVLPLPTPAPRASQ
ncbi:MAG: DUF4118 domain-containing protein [Caulobacter sp.]|nr:DUF4118 domain-containing protein [Caulobacter sp.]